MPRSEAAKAPACCLRLTLGAATDAQLDEAAACAAQCALYSASPLHQTRVVHALQSPALTLARVPVLDSQSTLQAGTASSAVAATHPPLCFH